MTSARVIMNIVEKGLDGMPIPGPKAAFGAAAEALRTIQVRLSQFHNYEVFNWLR
jgi:hypothetical protein